MAEPYASYEELAAGTVACTVMVRTDLLVDVDSAGRVLGIERIGDEVRALDLEDVIRVLVWRREPGGQP